MYSDAISELEVTLSTYQNNEPIWRAEGNAEQADLCRRKVVSIEAAIQRLRDVSA